MDGIIADGAIRSGKTVAMSLSFVLWAMASFNGQNFGMCGKTIGSFRRNVLFWLKLMLRSRGYKIRDLRTDNLLIVTRGQTVNYFYLFGGKDERSQDLIQGITLAGILFDEVALMPESFVNQATGRCSIDGSKFWFNCNPQGPKHWFKNNWIDQRKSKNLLYLHFTMDDNLSLSESIKARYRAMYTGVFFQRYILGLWVLAEGVIYGMFANDTESFILDEYPDNIAYVTIGVDFGGNKSAHAFVCSGFTTNFKQIVKLEEYYKQGIISPDELAADFVDFVRMCTKKWRVIEIRADSAEQVLIAGLQKALLKAGIMLEITNAIKGPIIERIRFDQTMMGQGRYKVMRHCTRLIEALQSAVWDDKKQDDVRLDDGTTMIDPLDASEYSTEPFIEDLMYGGFAA